MRPRARALRLLVSATVAAFALLIVAAPAGAHVQVRPAEAAPLDPTLWTVLVPNERSASTTKVELQVPEGVFPFSYVDLPDWKRTLTLNKDKTVNTIVWEGSLAEDGLAEFQFLATTPEQEGEIAWKALQTYDDGTVARWIGDEDSEEPASVTTVSASVPPQNAGGEGNETESASPAEEPAETTMETADDSGGDDLTKVLAVLALVLAVAALGLSLRRPRS